MTFDKHLASGARNAVKDSSPERQQYTENLIHEWEPACILSRGLEANRRAHWEKIAAHLRAQLAAMAGEKPRQLAGK